jgi:hypothetical protein
LLTHRSRHSRMTRWDTGGILFTRVYNTISLKWKR